MKRLLCSIFSCFLLLNCSLWADQIKPYTVVIDAGHGGKDPGALGTIVNEKSLNLSAALELGKLISTNMPEVKVVYTRKTDVFLSLQERADIANKQKADLFISIHTNSVDNKSTAGSEVYTLGLHVAESNLNVAMRENSVMLLEDGYQTTYQGFNPNSVESYIMFEFMQDQYIDKSVNFASKAQAELHTTAGRADRGVRQAGFWVLHKSSCPSVLVEMGFITNPQEQAFLASKEGQQKIAKAIYNAFVDYKYEIDKRSGQPQTLPTATTGKSDNQTKEQDKTTNKEVLNKDTVQSSLPVKSNVQQSVSEQKNSLPIYKIQCFAVKNQLKNNDPAFKGEKMDFYKENGWYKYTVGNTTNYDEILAIQQSIKQKFSGSFIIAFIDGKKVPLADVINKK